MRVYQTKAKKLIGTSFPEVRKRAFKFYGSIRRNTKRKPYVRSAYFQSSKVFLELFWSHLFEKKNYWDQIRRMKFLPCAIELIQYSRFEPASKENPNKSGEILHRFTGKSFEGEVFFVQVKENKVNGRKFLISVFPEQ